ncbi:MAG: nitroreductase family protein [Alphaproteobacteria bacterium]|nr:nitroreductase family protein [Alphaproteobacteria bacterium]
MSRVKNSRVWRIISKIKKNILGDTTHHVMEKYYKKFKKYSFVDCQCVCREQFEASIIRLYHTIEKGLSYKDYRVGFGKENVEKLLLSLEQYTAVGFDTSLFFYKTALSCLYEYIKKNEEHGHSDYELLERIKKLPEQANSFGGVINISAPLQPDILPYDKLVTSRHSIRDFSDVPVDIVLLKEAIRLSQYTPSACNRQGWKTRVVADKNKITKVLNNQNGNRGFGHKFDKLLVVTADLRAQQRDRELFQAFIDGGMYAENLLNCLYYKGIGSVPLSASLTYSQENNIRKILKIDDAEVFILFIGIGNYPDGEILTTRSERKPVEIEVI